jgi:class 3 adenylate cyclase
MADDGSWGFARGRARIRSGSAEPTLGQAARLLDELTTQAAWRGERGVAIARIVLAVMVVVRSVVSYVEALARGDFVEWNAIAASAVAIALSVGVLAQRAPSSKAVRRTAWITAHVDALLPIWVVALTIIKPDESFRGVIRDPYVITGLVAVFGASLRLSRRVVMTTTATTVAGVIGLVVLDHATQAARIEYGYDNVVLVIAFIMTAGIVATFAVARTHRLVVDAARAVLEKSLLKDRFGAYVSNEVADVLVRSPELYLGGTRQVVTVLFTDLRGFTRASEHLSPDVVVKELNAYFEVVVGAVHGNGGVIDKYIGDGVMATFGVPTPKPDDAARAIAAACATKTGLDALNVERARDGRPPLVVGIGVHTGDCVAGNIGTPERAQYTIIGDTVNVASRLEAATKEHGVAALISSTTVDAARARGAPLDALVDHGTVAVRGRDEGVAVFALAA